MRLATRPDVTSSVDRGDLVPVGRSLNDVSVDVGAARQTRDFITVAIDDVPVHTLVVACAAPRQLDPTRSRVIADRRWCGRGRDFAGRDVARRAAVASLVDSPDGVVVTPIREIRIVAVLSLIGVADRLAVALDDIPGDADVIRRLLPRDIAGFCDGDFCRRRGRGIIERPVSDGRVTLTCLVHRDDEEVVFPGIWRRHAERPFGDRFVVSVRILDGVVDVSEHAVRVRVVDFAPLNLDVVAVEFGSDLVRCRRRCLLR